MKTQKSKSSRPNGGSAYNLQETRLYQKQQEVKKKITKINSYYELQKIYSTVKNQNQQLNKDLAVLNSHLLQIQENKKLKSSSIKFKHDPVLSSRLYLASEVQIDPSEYPPELISQWQKLKSDLQEQYKLMNYLKGSITNMQKQISTEEVDEEKRLRKNKIKQIQAQIINENSKKVLLHRENQKLQQTINAEFTNKTSNSQSIEQYEKQNQQLRKKLLAFKHQTYRHQTKAARVIDQIYKKKQILTQHQSINNTSSNLNKKSLRPQIESETTQMKQRAKSFSNNFDISAKTVNSKAKNILVVSQIAKVIAKQSPVLKTNEDYQKNQSSLLCNEVTNLKQQITKISLSETKLKEETKKKKQSLKEQTNKLIESFKELQTVKIKKINQLNHLKSKVQSILKQIQIKSTLKDKKVDIAVQQTQSIEKSTLKPLRRDFAGIIGHGLYFDDRVFLKQKRLTFIKGIIVYENDKNSAIKGSLVALRAIYTDEQTNFLNQVPITRQYLKKCRIQRFELPKDDFLKLIKVKYNTKQTRVTKIELRSNRNLKYQFGDKKPFHQVQAHQTVYAFDIGLNEFPASFFSTFCHVRGCWYLQSIGAEIDTLS